MASLGILWGLLYIYYDQMLAGLIPLSYSLLSFASITFFILTRRYHLFRTSQLILSLSLPFLFIGMYFFSRYQNPIIIFAGIFSAIVELVFDTVLILFNDYLQYGISLPFLAFFIMGIFVAGLAIFLEEKIYKKK